MNFIFISFQSAASIVAQHVHLCPRNVPFDSAREPKHISGQMERIWYKMQLVNESSRPVDDIFHDKGRATEMIKHKTKTHCIMVSITP